MLVFFIGTGFRVFQVGFLAWSLRLLFLSPNNANVSQGSILGSTLFLLHVNRLPDVTCNIAIYVDITVHLKCDWLLICGKYYNCLLNLNVTNEPLRFGQVAACWFAWKSLLVSFDSSNNIGAMDEKNEWACPWRKIVGKKIEALIRSMTFLFLELFFTSTNLPYSLTWSTVAMPGLVFLIATWIRWISYRYGYVWILVVNVLLLLNPWLIIEI